jgi:hypothetical protein
MSLVAKDFREQLADAHFIVNYEYVRHLVMPFLISLSSQDSMRDSRFGQVRLWR